MSYAKFFLYICSAYLIVGFLGGCQKENDFIKITDPQPNDTLYQYGFKNFQFHLKDSFNYAYLLITSNEKVAGRMKNDSTITVNALKSGNTKFKIVAVDSHYSPIKSQEVTLKAYKNPYFTDSMIIDNGTLKRQNSQKAKDAIYIFTKYRSLGNIWQSLDIKDIQDKLHSIDDINNKVTMINTWSLNCRPCRAELPALEAIANFWEGNNNVNLWGFYKDSLYTKNGNVYLKTKQFQNGQVNDTLEPSPHPFHQFPNSFKFWRSKGLYGVPYNIILNSKGKIVWLQGATLSDNSYLTHQANYTIKQLLED